MLTNKILYSTNILSNETSFSSGSSMVPNTLFELMKTNILIIENNIGIVPCSTGKESDVQKQVHTHTQTF